MHEKESTNEYREYHERMERMRQELQELDTIIPQIIDKINEESIQRESPKSQAAIASAIFVPTVALLYKYHPVTEEEYQIFKASLTEAIIQNKLNNILITIKLLNTFLSLDINKLPEQIYGKQKIPSYEIIYLVMKKYYEALSGKQIKAFAELDLIGISEDVRKSVLNSFTSEYKDFINEAEKEKITRSVDYIFSAIKSLLGTVSIPESVEDDHYPWSNTRTIEDYRQIFNSEDSLLSFDGLIERSRLVIELGAGLSVIGKNSLFQAINLTEGKRCYAIDPVYNPESPLRFVDKFLQGKMIKYVRSDDFSFRDYILPGYIQNYTDKFRGKADLVVAAWVLEHIDYESPPDFALETFRSIAEVLKSKGAAFIGPFNTNIAEKVKKIAAATGFKINIIKEIADEEGGKYLTLALIKQS